MSLEKSWEEKLYRAACAFRLLNAHYRTGEKVPESLHRELEYASKVMKSYREMDVKRHVSDNGV